MKVLFIGDIHGRTDWNKYAGEAMKAGYEIVFLGDYVDSFDVEPYKIEQNLLQIIAFKKRAEKRKAWVTKVTLLIGNHDYAYISEKNCSGHEEGWAQRYKEIFDQNWDLFDIAWGYNAPFTQQYTLASHAGITESFWRHYISRSELPHYEFVQKILGKDCFDIRMEKDKAIHKTPMHEILNVLKDKFGLLWKVGSERGGSGTPGVLWADLNELKKDPYPGIDQIVGHTGWHSSEFYHFNNGDNFIMKVDGIGKETQRIILTF